METKANFAPNFKPTCSGVTPGATLLRSYCLSQMLWATQGPAMTNDTRPSGAPGYGRERTLVNFVKFVLVGIVNTVFSYVLFALFYLLLGSHQLGITLATACGVVFNFHSTGRLVFRNRRLSALPPFLAGYAALWLVNILLLDELTALAISPLAGQALALPLLALLSYAINRYLVFGKVRIR